MNPINWWLAVPLVLSQLAGIAGFILGILNYRQARYRPKMEDQRKYRAQLRDCLFPLQAALGPINTALSLDRPLPETLPTSISDADEKIKELQHVLDGNDLYSQVSLLRGQLINVRYGYSGLLPLAQKVNAGDTLTEKERRRYNSAHASLQDHVKKASTAVDKCVKLSVELDDVRQFEWRFWRKWALVRVRK